MKIHKNLHQLALAARDREPEGKWHMLVHHRTSYLPQSVP